VSTSSEVQLCRVLEEDPDLAEVVPENRRQAAIETCRAPLLRFDSGPWRPPTSLGYEVMGMLVLDGMMIRKIAVGSRFAVVLFGAGDLLRPWHTTTVVGASIPTQWVVSAPTQVAMLDANFTRQLAEYPELAAALVQRVIEINREMSVNMAIASHTRVDARLHMLMWQMAGRWGRMRSDGVLLPLKLTHQLLGDLVAARRPTVTTALSELSERGLIQQRDDGWLLKGEPPQGVLSVA
jgi:CRP/FNR family transcriptional regulator, cyclic AMP receptor protein